MYWVQENLEQPDIGANLIRYMDEWKLKSFLEQGICFTQVFMQEDNFDGTSWTNNGLGRFMNNFYHCNNKSNYRQNCYISCWTIQDLVSEDKFTTYCKFKYKSKKSDYGYAVSISNDKLIDFIKSGCDNVNGSLVNSGYFVNWGKILYKSNDDMKPIATKAGHQEIETFYKKKNFETENEFRVKLTLASHKSVPVNGNYLIEKNAEKVHFVSGSNLPKFICDDISIYRYQKSTKEIVRLFYKDYSEYLHKLGVLDDGESLASQFIKKYSEPL